MSDAAVAPAPESTAEQESKRCRSESESSYVIHGLSSAEQIARVTDPASYPERIVLEGDYYVLAREFCERFKGAMLCMGFLRETYAGDYNKLAGYYLEFDTDDMVYDANGEFGECPYYGYDFSNLIELVKTQFERVGITDIRVARRDVLAKPDKSDCVAGTRLCVDFVRDNRRFDAWC